MIGFVGTGKMGGAIVRALATSDEKLLLYDKVLERAGSLCEETGSRLAGSLQELLDASAEIFICVKPQDIRSVLGELSPADGKLVVSVVASVPTSFIEKHLGKKCRVVRVMPNTPCQVGAGFCVFARGNSATPSDAERVSSLLSTMGGCIELEEKYMDAVTALSGSAPAFVYLIIEALSDGAVMCGLPRDIAIRLASETVIGAGRMVLETGRHPAQLKDDVASPAGTTVEGLRVLEERALRSALIEALRSAKIRSQQISKLFGV